MLSRFIHLRLQGAADPFRSPYNDTGKGGEVSTPDYSKIAEANKEAADKAYKAASEDLAFRKDVYADSKPWQQELYGKASQIADQQIGLADTAKQRSDQQWQDYNNAYRPTEKVSAADSYGARYLNDAENAGLMDLLNGKEVAGGKYARPDQYDSSGYTALQQKIKAGGTNGLSQSEIDELVNLMAKQPTVSVEKSGTTVADAVNNAYFSPMNGLNANVEGSPSMASVLASTGDGGTPKVTMQGLSGDEQDRLKALLGKQAAGPGAYQLTDEDKAVLAKYGQDKAAYEKAMADYSTEQDTLRSAGLSSVARQAEQRAADQAEVRADADNASAFAQASRSLSRFGGDPNKMAVNAVGLANAQALNKTNAGNTAREQAADKLAAMRAGTVATGRNQVNTAGQNVGLSTGAGNSAVQNQNAGFMSGLPYAQYQSGGTAGMLGAAQMQQQGNLGLGSLMNQGYGISNQNSGGGLGSVLGLVGTLGAAYMTGGASLAASDRRLKENVVEVGKGPHGLPLYEFNYVQRPGTRYRGVMADDVEVVMPEAVILCRDGFKAVNYGMLGMQMVEV